MRIRVAGLAVVLAVTLMFGAFSPAIVGGQGSASGGVAASESVSVIVRVLPGRAADVEAFVAAAGGRVTDTVDMIGALVCEVPVERVDTLRAQPTVAAVTVDATCSDAADYTWTPDSDIAAQPAATNVFLDTTRVRSVWRLERYGRPINGRGVTIAVIDSGITDGADFRYEDYRPGTSCIDRHLIFATGEASAKDANGHGTHVAGLIGGDGSASAAGYSGVAPGSHLINLKVSGADAQATEGEVLKALQWVYENHDAYNIRVVNMSLNSDVSQSYKESPIDAACEILWFNGIVVVASAGNSGPNGMTLNAAPANDPFVITVGATDEAYSSTRLDDRVASFSTYGTTSDGVTKPEVYAPGRNIFSTLSPDSLWADRYPERVDVSGKYFRMSGTSASAPIVTGAAALMLQYDPSLTPDQVKNRLVRASNTVTDPTGVRRPYLDAYGAVTSSDMRSANTGLEVSTLLTTGEESILTGSVMWNSVMWNSVMWNSVMWNSVMWNSVMWNSVMWNSGETLSCQSVMWH